jgi:hypothetical protein
MILYLLMLFVVINTCSNKLTVSISFNLPCIDVRYIYIIRSFCCWYKSRERFISGVKVCQVIFLSVSRRRIRQAASQPPYTITRETHSSRWKIPGLRYGEKDWNMPLTRACTSPKVSRVYKNDLSHFTTWHLITAVMTWKNHFHLVMCVRIIYTHA